MSPDEVVNNAGVRLLRITLDTNAATPAVRVRIEEACRSEGLTAEIAQTTVTDRETERTRFATRDAGEPVPESMVSDESPWNTAVRGGAVCETLVLDESRLDEGALGAEIDDLRLEGILHIIGNGSYPRPGSRERLTTGQRSQLCDAMALEAHAREGRDVFISDDAEAFTRERRRELLEALCQTRIATVDEFCADPRGLI